VARISSPSAMANPCAHRRTVRDTRSIEKAPESLAQLVNRGYEFFNRTGGPDFDLLDPEVEARLAHVWTLRDEKAIRFEVYASPERALDEAKHGAPERERRDSNPRPPA
jgi:hypothetical protein